MPPLQPAWPDVDATKVGEYTTITIPPNGHVPLDDQDAPSDLDSLLDPELAGLSRLTPTKFTTEGSGSRSPSPDSLQELKTRMEHDHEPSLMEDLPELVNDLRSPSSPTFVPPSLDAEAYLRSLSPVPPPMPLHLTREALSPNLLPPRAPTPPIPALNLPDEEVRNSDEVVSGHDGKVDPTAPRHRLVRFKSRVRISSGTHHHHNQAPSLSRSSSVSDSSSMSAPLRPAPEEHLPAIPPATLDETFSEEAFSAWLQQDNLSNKRWVWPEGEEDADERTALIAHRKRRGDLYKPDLRRPEGPPRIITANGLPSRSPSLSPISPKRRHYGSVAGSESGEESVTSDRRSPRFLRRRRRRKVEGGINEPWTWDTSWLNPRVWWTGVRRLLCCFPTPQDDEVV